MGNETSSFADCKFEGEVSLSSRECWTLNQATSKDGRKVSVFVYTEPQKHNKFVENAAKYLKILRHPGIVKFLALHREAEETWLITERVQPLETVLDSLSAPEICAGLYTLAETLAFLHDKVGVCHNNICLSSVCVSPDGSWQLGSLDFMCKFQEATPAYLSKCKSLRNEATIAPEEKVGKMATSIDLGHVRDAYGFGMLAEGLSEYLTELGDLTKTFELRIQDEFLSKDPQDRPQLSTILVDRLFRNDYLEIMNFLKSVTIKSADEKKNFFWGLPQKLHQLPVTVVASRLVRPLLSRFVLLDTTACECLVPHLLTPYIGTERAGLYKPGNVNPLLPEPLFKRYVIPELYKIFHVRDAHIRRVLLRHFSHYVRLFDKETLQKSLLPQILLGLKDSDDHLAALSLHAVADLVPILGGSVVIGAHRAKIFSQSTPKFGLTNAKQAIIEKKTELKSNKQDMPIQNGVPHKTRIDEKKTLKDLAREAERLKRKEEARKRAEERKKKREERKNKPVPAQVVTGSPDTHSTLDGELNDQSEQAEADWNEWGGTSHSDTTNQRDDSSPSSPERTNQSGADQTESDIDREIEEELQGMDSPPSTPPDLGPPVTVDWSDVTREPSRDVKKEPAGAKPDTHRKGVLKLKQKTRTSPPPGGSTRRGTQQEAPPAENGGTWHAEDWGDNEDNWGSLEVTSTTFTSQTSSVPGGTPGGDGVQGLEVKPLTGSRTFESAGRKPPKVRDLDIDSLDIKTSKTPGGMKKAPDPELDLFADMAPVITTHTNLLSLLGGASEVTPSGVTSSSTSFAVQDTTDSGDAGWGDDDLDWGDPDES